MNTKALRILFQVLLFAALVPLLIVAWRLAPPWFGSETMAAQIARNACKTSAHCKGLAARYVWDTSKGMYVFAARAIVKGKVSQQVKAEIEQKITAAVNDYAESSVFFRKNLRNLYVEVKNG